MPSTVVHVALAGLIGTALLAQRFDARSIVLVMAVTAVIDLDTVIDIWIPGAHRAYFHNLVIPAAVLLALWWDVRWRETSYIKRRWGEWGVRVTWVSMVALVFAHVLLDAFFNGVNLFWPLHDRFYDLSGEFLLSDQRGVVQTFIDGETAEGTVEETHYTTGVNPTPEETPQNVERLFPIAGTGERFLLVISGFAVVAMRLIEERRSD
ncbi:metal-dependent hydrolase [Natronoarchaeum sp. GCM10025321]|uniref:metal-dependent hydrolase n=2 Tax=unclassified Natronoarchaeum TaxID=2620183 RepID=UPI0036185B1C